MLLQDQSLNPHNVLALEECEERVMKFLAANCQPSCISRAIPSVLSLVILGPAFADCVMTTSAPHTNLPTHLVESVPAGNARISCNRDSTSNVALSGTTASTTTSRLDDTIGASHWLVASRSAEQIATENPHIVGADTPVQHSLSEVHWADARDWIHNPPEWLREAKNYKRQGMPILHLMQSEDKNTLLAIGVSNHGKPGLYLTRKLPF